MILRASRIDACEAVITIDRRQLVKAITKARRRLLDKLLGDWTIADVQALAQLNRRLADAMRAGRDSSIHDSRMRL